ncbi:MAG: hypothetical protein A2Y33_04350 [Spirochaetes bacterium GWF1_51_8]|nr:MAG: hypothetical protein A2Y33_04350 [Spirochaetes bacterium GWF1_51_8]
MKKILIIDDNLTVVKNITKKISDNMDVSVDSVGSLADANALLVKSSGDYLLAIAGVVLPDALKGEAVDLCLEAGIPVIVLTALYDDEIREQLISKNVVDYIIEKDAGYADELLSAIKRIIRNMNQKVLIVDDSSFHRKFLDRLMHSQQFKVFEAEDGEKALQFIKDNPDISLVIADYDMPKMDGLQLLSEIRAKHGKDEVTIIILSGESNEEIVPKFLKHGANDYVQKPFNREEFLCRVNMNLDNMEMIRRLKSIAYFDVETGLFNRSYFYEVGHAVHSNAQRNKFEIAVAIVRIDDFKEFGQTYGTEFTHNILKIVANVFDMSLKRRSDVLARYSGPYLVVATEYQNIAELTAFYQSIQEKVRLRSFKYKSSEVKLGVSIALCSKLDTSLEKMVNTALNVMDKIDPNAKGIVLNDKDAGLAK